VLPVDDQFRLDPDSVQTAIEADRASGLEPFLLAVTAGTTNTGAIDPLPVLATLARREGLWLHVDAAYGGFFCPTERGQRLLAGIEAADSVVLDPHKTLFLPYGTGALLVRDRQHLKRTHSSVADYMPPMGDDEVLMDFCELSPELTRPFRGLRVWLPLKLHGAGVFRQYLDEKIDLVAWIEARIRQIPGLEILAPASLSIMAFALSAGKHTVDQRNTLTRRLLEAINARQRVHLTGTVLRGVFAIRICVVPFRTHLDRMQILLEDLQAALTEL